MTLTLSANELMQTLSSYFFHWRTHTLLPHHISGIIISAIFEHFKKHISPVLIAWTLEERIGKKLAADHVCANLLTGSVSFSISDIKFISQKIHMHVSARIAGCKNDCIQSIRKLLIRLIQNYYFYCNL